MDNEGAETISADGRFLVYTVCNRREDFGGCDLYYSEMKNSQWSTPRNIGLPVNSRAWESQPSLSADGRTLYFVSSRDGGKGKKDLWVTYKMRNGQWMNPRNLGDVINTDGDESSPHIHADGQTLYFSSDGHVGMGESDMFMTTRQADGTWSQPKNLGYPINTKSAENSLVVSLDGTTGYFASDREDSKGATDIYSFEMPQSIRPKPVTYLKAKVIDANTRLDLVANVELIQLSTGFVYTEAVTAENGEFLICLPSGDDYALNVSRKGYLFYSENYALKEATSFEAPFQANVALQPIGSETLPRIMEIQLQVQIQKRVKQLSLKMYFLVLALPICNRLQNQNWINLVVLLKENPTIKIQINGHTDNVGNPETNQKLSLNRATAVMNYLIENGIETDRLTAKGFGENQPIDTNETEIGRKNNRRTEFIVR
ncbi:MAG: OmpA family protein [Saprospiraceae bacterium]|nr:OmpA family protein [Saprospiraceae bacterium]